MAKVEIRQNSDQGFPTTHVFIDGNQVTDITEIDLTLRVDSRPELTLVVLAEPDDIIVDNADVHIHVRKPDDQVEP